MFSPSCFFARFFIKVAGFASLAVIALGPSAALAASAQVDARAASSPERTIEITYVANEGFLISAAGRKVLIDGLFTEGFGRFYTPAAEILDKERRAAPPFDDIDVVLVSHYHPDHINPVDVVQHLSNDAKAVLIGPPQVSDLLKPINGYATVAPQILIVSPGSGDATESSVRDIKIRSVALQHLSDAQRKHQNLGFLLSLGEFKLFHVGDAGASEVAEYKNLKLAGEHIDIAFLNHFWFDNENAVNAREIIGYLKPKAVILMHMDVGKADDYRNLIGPMSGLPPVYMAESPMETLRFRLVDGKLSTDGIPLQSQAYLGQPPPGDTAVVFAQGVVSDGHVHGRLAISLDGRDLFWTTVSAGGGQGGARIMHVARERSGWTPPHVAVFTVPGQAANPLFSPDGTKLYFNFTEDRAKGWRTRYVERTEQGWSEPMESGFLLNPSSSFTKSGRVYYTDHLAGKPWNWGTYVAEYSAKGYTNPRALPANINSPFIDYTPYITPDESFLMFCSSRPSPEEKMFLFVSFRGPDGGWLEPRPMNEALGFAGNARFPSLSPDGRYLFFCGDDGNIYWVRAEVVNRLGPYLGQTPPARAAGVFAPGVISIPRDEGGFAERPVFSPDYRECFFDVTNYKTKTFTSCSMRCENGVWSKPEPAFFTRFGGVQASIAADGGTLFFSGPSPTAAKIRGIWMSRRESKGWADPVFLDPPVNTSTGAGFPCVVRSGALYFMVLSGSDRGLHRARMADGRFPAVEKVAAFQPRPDCIFGDFFVAPDEGFLVIYATLPDNLGQGDLYVSFRRADGSWTEPRNLGPEVNTKGYDFAPSLSPDGRYLFFTRDQGGTGSVYWISTATFGATGSGVRDANAPDPIARHQPRIP